MAQARGDVGEEGAGEGAALVAFFPKVAFFNFILVREGFLGGVKSGGFGVGEPVQHTQNLPCRFFK